MRALASLHPCQRLLSPVWDYSHFYGCKVVSHCGFCFISYGNILYFNKHYFSVLNSRNRDLTYLGILGTYKKRLLEESLFTLGWEGRQKGFTALETEEACQVISTLSLQSRPKGEHRAEDVSRSGKAGCSGNVNNRERT